VFALLRSLLRVHGDPVPDDALEMLRAAAKRSGMLTVALEEMLAHTKGTRSIPPARAADVLGGIHVALKQFVAHVDSMLHPDAPAID
jgi:hypothetical protein